MKRIAVCTLCLILLCGCAPAEEALFSEEGFEAFSAEEVFEEACFDEDFGALSGTPEAPPEESAEGAEDRSVLWLQAEDEHPVEGDAWKQTPPTLAYKVKGNTITLTLRGMKLPKGVKYYVYEADAATGAALQVRKLSKAGKIALKNRPEGTHVFFARAERVDGKTKHEEYGLSSERVTVEITDSRLWKKAPALTARQTDAGTILISWAVKEEAESYLLTITRGKGKSAVRLDPIEVTGLSYEDKDAKPGVKNSYRVVPVKGEAKGKASRAKTCALNAAPWRLAPVIRSVTNVGDRTVEVRWTAAAPAEKFVIACGKAKVTLEGLTPEENGEYKATITARKAGNQKVTVQPVGTKANGKADPGKKSAAKAVTVTAAPKPGPYNVKTEVDGTTLRVSWESRNEETMRFLVRVFTRDGRTEEREVPAEPGRVAYETEFTDLPAGVYGVHVRAVDAGGGIHDDTAKIEKVFVLPADRILKFGRYEQDNNMGNGAEPLEWQILAVKDGKALVISKYGLDDNAYDKHWREITWAECTLRSWLNNDFLDKAFSEQEREAIQLTVVDNSHAQGNPNYNTDGGKDTQDRIFLLSFFEVWMYFRGENARKCLPTAYANAQGLNLMYGCCDWWLRSPGREQNYAMMVNGSGSFNFQSVDSTDATVRPAMWVDLESVL